MFIVPNAVIPIHKMIETGRLTKFMCIQQFSIRIEQFTQVRKPAYHTGQKAVCSYKFLYVYQDFCELGLRRTSRVRSDREVSVDARLPAG